MKRRVWSCLLWGLLAVLIVVPVVIAGTSPYLQYRDPIYIIAGFAGIICLALFLIQPLLAANVLPGLHIKTARKLHQWGGGLIAMCVAMHIGGLYLTSPPDTVDALLLRAPTAFSVFGVVAMWGVIATIILVAARRRFLRRFAFWHVSHHWLTVLIVISTVIHAVQIDGTMGMISKAALCGAVVLASGIAVFRLRLS